MNQRGMRNDIIGALRGCQGMVTMEQERKKERDDLTVLSTTSLSPAMVPDLSSNLDRFVARRGIK